MKTIGWFVVAYWVVGCIILGMGVATEERRCPGSSKDMSLSDALVVVTMWPLDIGMAIEGINPPLACDRLDASK